jgi:starvation-inducible DNA-binding protein
MEKVNLIDLDIERSRQLSEDLNDLLANYQVFYMNVRGFHWNIRGSNFFVLHIRFEELYKSLEEKIDAIAERILSLGNRPAHSFNDYLQVAEVKEARNVSDAAGCVIEVLNGLRILIAKQRSIVEMAQEIQDDGTDNLLSEYVYEQEKLIWMYSAFLNE